MNFEIPTNSQFENLEKKMTYEEALEIVKTNQGLDRSLYEGTGGWPDNEDERPTLSEQEVAKLMADDEKIEEAVRIYIDKTGGDMEARDNYRSKIGWALVEELKARLKQSENVNDKNRSNSTD